MTGNCPWQRATWCSSIALFHGAGTNQTDQGHQVSDLVVRRLLREGGYSLQANVKTAEGGQHIDRDAQSRVLNDGAVEHMSSGDPVISVDKRRNSRRLQERWTGMATHR